MVARISNTELKKRRIAYYAALRKVNSLTTKRELLIKIIETRKKEKVMVDKVTKDRIVVTVKINDTQMKDEVRKLAQVRFELDKANDDLKKKDFGFSKANKSVTDKILNSREAYKVQKQEEKINDVKALVNSAVMNSGLQDVVEIQKMASEGGKLKEIKPRLMKVVRKENRNGYPIRNVSDKTVEIIMAGLLNWNTEASDQPSKFPDYC